LERYAKPGLPALLLSGGMDHGHRGHGSMDSEGVVRQVVVESGEYSDRRIIDAMVPHQQGAIEVARVALKNTDNPRIRDLANNIVDT
jgi:uncharacterized protein (DUF305 family)